MLIITEQRGKDRAKTFVHWYQVKGQIFKCFLNYVCCSSRPKIKFSALNFIFKSFPSALLFSIFLRISICLFFLLVPEATTISNCDLNPDICHSNAFCAYDDDLLGSKCVCKTGFQGNGISCTGKGKLELSHIFTVHKRLKRYVSCILSYI